MTVVGSEQATIDTARADMGRRTPIGDQERMNERGGKSALRAALVFGVVAATIEMGIVLWMMYC